MIFFSRDNHASSQSKISCHFTLGFLELYLKNVLYTKRMIFFTHKFDVFWYKQSFLSQDPWKLWVHFTSFHLILFHSDVGPLAIYEFSWWIKLPHVLSGGWSHLTNKGIFQKPLGVPKKNIGRWMKVHEYRSDNEQYPLGWPPSQ